jgi:hypothetical protein
MGGEKLQNKEGGLVEGCLYKLHHSSHRQREKQKRKKAYGSTRRMGAEKLLK